MNIITRKIKVPFQKIVYKSVFSKQTEMNELESLIVILIATSREEAIKRKTLIQGLESYYGIKEHTLPLIKIALDSLVNSRTIILDDKNKETLDDLLNKKLRSLRINMSPEIIEKVTRGVFVKNTKNNRTVHKELFISVVSKTEPIGNKVSVYDGKWGITDLSDSTISQEAEDHSDKQRQKNESTFSFELDYANTKVVYLEDTISFKKTPNMEIVPVNPLSEVVFSEILKENIDSSTLGEMMDTSIEDINFIDQDGISIDNNYKIINVNGDSLILRDSNLLQLFNKQVSYKISDTNNSFNTNELYGHEITIQDLATKLIDDGEVNKLKEFPEYQKELSKIFLSMNVTSQNEKFIKYFLNKLSTIAKITTHNELTSKLLVEAEIREFLKAESQTFVETNINELNAFIDKTKLISLYTILHSKLKKQYELDTVVFPNWDKELQYQKFVKDNSKLNAKYMLLDRKSEAENFIQELSSYDFSPIVSIAYNEFKTSVKKMVLMLPIDSSEKVKTYGSRIRLMLEELVSKQQKSKLKFFEALEIAIENEKINKKHKNALLKIYKASNVFHHESDIVVDSKLEKSIKKDIIHILEVAKESKITLKNYKEAEKWATV